MITVGTKTKNKKYGTGICLKVDPNDNFMTYYFSFSITHLLNLLESCTAPLVIITKGLIA